MKTSNLVLGVACLCFSQLAWCQSPKPSGLHGIPGYFDSATGAFQPFNQPLVPEAGSAVAVVPRTGKFVVNIRGLC